MEEVVPLKEAIVVILSVIQQNPNVDIVEFAERVVEEVKKRLYKDGKENYDFGYERGRSYERARIEKIITAECVYPIVGLTPDKILGIVREGS